MGSTSPTSDGSSWGAQLVGWLFHGPIRFPCWNDTLCCWFTSPIFIHLSSHVFFLQSLTWIVGVRRLISTPRCLGSTWSWWWRVGWKVDRKAQSRLLNHLELLTDRGRSRSYSSSWTKGFRVFVKECIVALRISLRDALALGISMSEETTQHSKWCVVQPVHDRAFEIAQ